MNRKDIAGQKFGRWLAISYSHSKRGMWYWSCICECGTKSVVNTFALQKGTSKSCGCFNREVASKRSLKDLTGERFGRLVVQGISHRKGDKVYWKCLCDCGSEVVVVGCSLTCARTKSCGCLRSEVSRKRLSVKGPGHPYWKGGRFVGAGSYILVWSPNHPNATKAGYVNEHRLVMEKMLGRHLTAEEVVHHCNNDRADNRPYNLRLFPTKKEHTEFHHKLRRSSIVLPKEGTYER